jgi:hypothetical protein
LFGPAAADLYRWVDPETGSIKYSSTPPPWYGDARRERRAPKVEVIPSLERRGAAAFSADAAATPAVAGAESLAVLEARRRQALEALRLAAAQASGAIAPADLARRIEAYAALVAELDRLDPQGAAARRAETQAALAAIARMREAPR